VYSRLSNALWDFLRNFFRHLRKRALRGNPLRLPIIWIVESSLLGSRGISGSEYPRWTLQSKKRVIALMSCGFATLSLFIRAGRLRGFLLIDWLGEEDALSSRVATPQRDPDLERVPVSGTL